MDASKKCHNPNPRLSANFLSRLIFWWLKPIFAYGKHHDLEVKDLYNVLPDDVSQLLGNKLEGNWIKEVESAQRVSRKPSYFKALKRTFLWSFAYYGGWTLFLALGLRVLQPYVLGLLIWHFDPRSASSSTEAYIYASMLISIAILIAFINHHSYLGLMEIGMRMRIASSSLIYRKILRLSKSSLNVTTPGQIINLLSNDVARFEQLFIWLHYIWILPIQGALIAYMIWQSVGIASLAGIFLISVQTIPIQGWIGKLLSKLRLRIAVKTDERIRLMSEIVSGIQVIKMYAWEKPFEKLVSIARSYEVDVLTVTSYLRGFTLATFVFTERTTLYFTVMAYVLLGNSISADKVFSMAQYFNILQATMAIFYPIAVASAAEAAVSVKRIERFLLLNENTCAIEPVKTKKSDEYAIRIEKVSASWTVDAITNTLHNLSVQIEKGKLYAIVGAVGSGKTSVLQLMLKELFPSHGHVRVSGTVSYAGQEAWLFSGSVRNNILFGAEYDKVKYNRIIHACCLAQDLKQFTHGDKTLVGDKGAALSGGQRARINLARTVYRDADIYLLDDPLSAVDTHVGKHLFEECIVKHLNNKTRILVTHQVQYLKNCDRIILINNGMIEATGTFAELQQNHRGFLNILDTEEDKEESKTPTENENNVADISLNTSKDEEEDEPEETEELMAKGSLSKTVYWKYFRAGGSIIMIITFLLLLIVGQFGSSGTDYWVAYWTRQEETRIKMIHERAIESLRENFTSSTIMPIDSNNTSMNASHVFSDTVTDILLQNVSLLQDTNFINTTDVNMNEGGEDYYYLSTNTALWIYGMFVTLSIVLTTSRNLIYYKICMNASKNLHTLMFSCLLKAPMLFFDTHPAGRILNRFSKDIGSVDEMLPKTMIESIQIFAVMTGILAQVLIINWWTVFPMLFMGFLYWQIRNIYLKTAQSVKRLEGITKSPVFSHVNSSLLGLITIRSAGAQSMVSKEFDSHQDLHTGAYFLSIATSTGFGFALDIVSLSFVAFITYSFIIFDDGNTFAGNVGLALSQVLILCGMLQHGMRQTAEAIAQMTSVERILQFTTLDKEGPFESEPGKKPPAEWPSKGEIVFDHVYLRYADLSPAVLKDLNLVIKAGQRVGIVGRTGAGKTSLITALFNLAQLEGTIYIDGVNIQKIGLHDLRQKISIIPQESVLFSATLRQNLDPFDRYDDATLWNALEDVELKGAMPSLDYRIEQSGTNLSAGQRQLICLARAITRNNKILILDEATANVDPTTDALIQKTIRRKFKGCTVLTIAHRLNTIMDNDKVLVIDHGQLIEFDHPYVLLQNTASHFTKMVKEMGNATFEQLKNIAKEAYETISPEEPSETINANGDISS